MLGRGVGAGATPRLPRLLACCLPAVAARRPLLCPWHCRIALDTSPLLCSVRTTARHNPFRDAAERGFQGARDGAESKLKKLRGGGDGEASRDEVEKAYRQCKIYQDENKELKKKLEQVSPRARSRSRCPPCLPCICGVCRALGGGWCIDASACRARPPATLAPLPSCDISLGGWRCSA